MNGEKGYTITVSLLFLFLFSLQGLAEEKPVELLFFYEEGCPHCARIDRFLNERIRTSYRVEIKRYEVHVPENASLLGRFASLYHMAVYTPAVVVGDTLIKGDERSSFRAIEASVREALRTGAPSPLSLVKQREQLKQKISLTAVLSAAAVDSINPCACAVLVLLLGTILAGRKSRRRVIKAGLAFTTSTLISYFFMGLGLFFAIRITGIQQYIYIGVSILAILIGLGNLKDYLWPGRWFMMEVPTSWRPRIEAVTTGVTSVPGAFGIGFLVSVFLLPCTSGPYVVVIGMLSESSFRLTAIGLLLIYNLIFVLPFIAITLGVGYGLTTTARVERVRREKTRHIHLITGLIMLAIGAGLIILVATGNI
jgi:cytochrome c biogenesis protein CcdA